MPLVVVPEAELLLGAEHALGDDAADLRRLDLAPSAEGCARRRERRAEPGRDVRRAADHREPAVRQRDAAEAVLVAGAIRPARASMASISPTTTPESPSTTGCDRRDLDARIDEAVGDLARRRGRCRRTPSASDRRSSRRAGSTANCCRKRRSLSKKSRMSSMPYFSMATRSTPMPNAQPVTSSGS